MANLQEGQHRNPISQCIWSAPGSWCFPYSQCMWSFPHGVYDLPQDHGVPPTQTTFCFLWINFTITKQFKGSNKALLFLPVIFFFGFVYFLHLRFCFFSFCCFGVLFCFSPINSISCCKSSFICYASKQFLYVTYS